MSDWIPYVFVDPLTVIDMDEIFHKPFIAGVTGSTKASIYSISSSPKTVGRNLKGAYIVAIDDMAIFSEDNIIDAFDTIRKTKNTSFKLIVGYLDKISAKTAQQELDELSSSHEELLCRFK